jgi:hypothetical protein
MRTIRHIAALPFIGLALAFWAAGMAFGMVSDATGAAAAKVMAPRRR